MRDFIRLGLFAAALLIGHHLHAQWSAPYANSWIDYGKPYVKIGILKKGLHRVPFSALPQGFPTGSPEKFQLWRRGREVSIISTANQEILFYAVPNDGASDSLLYRPMSARINPYFSMYSDEAAYFLTVGNKPGNRAKVVEKPVDEAAPVIAYHKELVTTVFQQDYSLGTKSSVNPGFFNSYFEWGASRTSEPVKEGTDLVLNFKLSDFASISQNPMLKLLLHGRSNNDRKIEVRIGKSKDALRLVKALDNSGFAAAEYAFEIKPEDMDPAKSGVLMLRSVSGERLERFSLAYYSIEYPQVIKLASGFGKELRLDAVTGKWSRMPVKGVPSQYTFTDISDTDNPLVLKTTGESLMVPREPGKEQVLLATSEIAEVTPSKIREVRFNAFSPKDGNYIIITTEDLRQGVKSYADYRASSAGGSLKPVIAEIQDVYNQFNYGEPGPVAIKKFMSYMLSEGVKDKYLFLVGKSITQNEKMVRELPGEVPTLGFPGSDALLVEGIAGAAINVPAIPVGRLSAVTNENITDYLQKVKAYEAEEAGEPGWRKKVLHLSGGKTTSEIVQLRDYLRDLEPIIVKGVMGGTVKSYVKKQPGEEVESLDISKDVNEGVGMITFFGHGSTVITDPDIGYARDVARNYHNQNKYPVMYFGGCGVGNVFSNRFNANPSSPKAGDRITLSLDWLVAPDRGAIAVIASSFESFVSPGVTYLHSLYGHMFENAATAGLPIGKIHLAVANDILSKYKDKYHIAYVHQSLLQGDPALRLAMAADPDYAIGHNEGIALLSESGNKTIGESDSLKVSIAISNSGRFVKDQLVPVEVTFTGKSGTHTKTIQAEAFAAQKVLQISFFNTKDIKSIKVQIDPHQTLKELTRDNNESELHIDWDFVKNISLFSSEAVKDNIPPLLSVKVNDRPLKEGEPVWREPDISITLSDDRQLAPDTTLVDLFIKPCATDACRFERVAYEGNKVVMNALGRELKLNFPTHLGPGVYEMLVNAKDLAGNAVVQPYRMYFEIGEPEEMRHNLVVSPNPATSYLRFELKAWKLLPVKSVRYFIYDQRGNELDGKTIMVADGSPTTEWYWERGKIGPGVYTYKVILVGEQGQILDTKTGRVVFMP
jgi:hypothetical protein